MDLTYVVAVFGMCVVATAAAPTPSEPSLQVAAAAESSNNSKRSRSLFHPPPSPHQYHQLQGGGGGGGGDVGLYDEVMDDPLASMYDPMQQQDDPMRTYDDADDDADPRTAGRARPAGNNKPDSPVYFIRLPPQPYVYVPGYGYVSQPTRLEPPPFAQRPHSPFLDIPLSYVSNAKPVGVYTLPQQQPFPYQQQQQQQFSGRPKPPHKRPQYAAPTTPQPPPPPPPTPTQQRPDSAIYNLDKGPYVFNGRPSDAYLLQSAYDSLYSEVLQNIYP